MIDQSSSHMLIGPRKCVEVFRPAVSNPTFSICTLLTNWDQYNDFFGSFLSNGFDNNCSEYLIIDNSKSNKANAYIGLNEFLQSASGDYVILVHQDVILLEQGRDELIDILNNLEQLDPAWGLCGNAGFSSRDTPVMYISHPVSPDHVCGGPFPAPVVSLDENFIVVKRAANLALSRDLAGFHHYGADLCIIADVLGWNAYVVPFQLHHFSGGKVDDSYHRSRQAICQKYIRAFRPRWINLVTEFPFYLSGSGSRRFLAISLRRARDTLRQVRAKVGRLRRRWTGGRST